MVELLDEVEIFDLAGFLGPMILFPGGSPFGKDIDPKFGVGMNLDWFVSSGSVLDSGFDSGGFHTNIGGVFVGTGYDWFFGLGVDYCPAAGAGVGTSTTISPKNFHLIFLHFCKTFL